MRARFLLLALLLSLVGCASGGTRIEHPLVGRPDVVTLVNLRPDENRQWLSTVNYQREGFVPVCTPVRIDSVGSKGVQLTVLTTGRSYTMEVHKTLVMPIEAHLDRTFGPVCPKEALAALGPVDQEGIRDGKVRTGMTREGVIRALGHPPDHATPDLAAPEWRYWINRFKTMVIVFSGDVVSEIHR